MAKKVNIKELSRRYTTAVFDLAKAEGKLERVSADLSNIAQALAGEPRFKKMLNAQSTNSETLVRELAKGMDGLTLNFLMIVARNGRLHYLADIIGAFQERIAEEKGELKAQITSAVKLDEKQLASIIKDLSAKSGKKIVAEQIVRPEIIGGLIVKIGAKMFDYSVKSRLTKLKNKLKESA